MQIFYDFHLIELSRQQLRRTELSQSVCFLFQEANSSFSELKEALTSFSENSFAIVNSFAISLNLEVSLSYMYTKVKLANYIIFVRPRVSKCGSFVTFS